MLQSAIVRVVKHPMVVSLLKMSTGKLRAKYNRWLDGSSPSATSSEDEGGHRGLSERTLYDIISADKSATTEDIKDAAQAAVSLLLVCHVEKLMYAAAGRLLQLRQGERPQ